MDWDGNIYDEPPEGVDPADVEGVVVHTVDPETGYEDWKWVYVPEPFEDWEYWAAWVDLVLEQYGWATA